MHDNLKLMIYSDDGEGTLTLKNGSRFSYTPGDFNSRQRALDLADTHVAEWRRTAERRAARPLTRQELATGSFAHAKATPAEAKEHERRTASLVPPVDSQQVAVDQLKMAQTISAVRGMSRVERAVFWEQRAREIDARDAQQPADSTAVTHARKTLDALERDPLAPEVALMRARERVKVAESDPAAYAALDRQWRTARAEEHRDARDLHHMRTLADDARAERETEAMYSRTLPTPVQQSAETPTEPTPAAPSSSLAATHAKCGLALARTPERQQHYQAALEGLSLGSITPAQYWEVEG